MKTRNQSAAFTSAISSIIESGNLEKGKSRAAKSGKMFEAIVFGLKKFGFQEFKYGDEPGILPARSILKNVPYNNLLKQTAEKHGIKRRSGIPKTEFVISARDALPTKEFPDSRRKFTARVECKWQEVSGTTQFKLMYTLADLQYSAPEDNIILLVDGNGFDESLKQLIRDMSSGIYWDKSPQKSPKSVHIMDVQEWFSWCSRAFGAV